MEDGVSVVDVVVVVVVADANVDDSQRRSSFCCAQKTETTISGGARKWSNGKRSKIFYIKIPKTTVQLHQAHYPQD